MSLALVRLTDEPAGPVMASRRRRVEKLRWQLRVSRRAVAAMRQEWESLSEGPPGPVLDRRTVAGFVTGALAALMVIAWLTGVLG